TVGLYVGSPYRWYRRSDTASPATTVAMISTAGSHRGKRRGFRRRPYRPGGNIGDGWSVVACVSVTAVFSVGCIGKNGRVPGYEGEAEVGPVAERLRLMAVHAHPDDESSKGAATMAKYVAEGADVLVVTCTGGERGSVLNPKLD